MFGVPVEKHGINTELRQKGKIATLACDYNSSVGVLKAMGALRMGLAGHELNPNMDAWRTTNPNIVQLWADVEQAAIDAISTRQAIRLRNLVFSVESGILFIELPSGRRLAYVKPQLGENRWGGASITYSGVTTGRKWGRLEIYGGKLVENIVQATARDLPAHAMTLVADAGHQIVMHVHDEIVIDESPSLWLHRRRRLRLHGRLTRLGRRTAAGCQRVQMLVLPQGLILYFLMDRLGHNDFDFKPCEGHSLTKTCPFSGMPSSTRFVAFRVVNRSSKLVVNSASGHWNGTPAAADGFALSISWKCKCGSLVFPVFPTEAITVPASTCSPSCTLRDPSLRCAYTAKEPSPWSMVMWLPSTKREPPSSRHIASIVIM
nr:hypothetical protein [Nanchangia anserum]